jgi:hypothetical protein
LRQRGGDGEERGGLALSRATPVGPDPLLASVHVGVLGIERLGDTAVNTVLLGRVCRSSAPPERSACRTRAR